MLGKRQSLTILTLRQRKAAGLLLWVAKRHVLLCDTLILLASQSDTNRNDYTIIIPSYN